MGQKKHRIIAVVGISFLVIHFALTSIYSMDFLVLPRSVRQVSQIYTVPFFHQNWSMFAPEVPEYDLQLQYRFPTNGTWSAWNETTESCGFEYRDRAEYLEQSICSGLAYQVAQNIYFENGIRKLDRIEDAFDYGKALNYAMKMHEHFYSKEIEDSLQIRLQFVFTPKPGSTEEKTDYLEFSTFIIPAH
jgi:hypothetical protein